MTKDSNLPILIAGAGPVGLFAALRLAQAGINSIVLEKGSTLGDLPRATGYFGASLVAFQKAGVLEKMRTRGFSAAGICWRKPLRDDGHGGKEFGEMLASLPMAADDTPGSVRGTIGLAQPELAKLLLEECQATGLVTVEFGTEVVGLQQDEHSVTVSVRSDAAGAPLSYTGPFLIGADGGSSSVRKNLGIPLKGHTWRDRFVAIDAYYQVPETEDINTHIVVSKEHYGLTTPIVRPIPGEASLHRVTIHSGFNDSRSDQELESDEAALDLLDKIIPGPRPLDARIRRASTYRLHQRCVGTLRRGRCLLAGDAAHINNVSLACKPQECLTRSFPNSNNFAADTCQPIGAMGLTTGVLDADAAADALILILKESKPVDILEIYSQERQRVFQLYVNPTTTQNFLRIQNDPEHAYDDWFLKRLADHKSRTAQEFGENLFKLWPTDMRKLTEDIVTVN